MKVASKDLNDQRYPLSWVSRNWDKLFIGLTFLAVILLCVPQLSSRVGTNAASRLATVDSLVHRGTFSINQSAFRFTVDRVKIGDDYYSSKPPLLPTLGAAVYWVYHQLTGRELRTSHRVTVPHLIYVLIFLPHLALLIFFYLFLRIWIQNSVAIAVSLFVFAFNYLGTGWAISLNNHTPAAAALFISFYYAFLIRRKDSSKRSHWALAGFFGGLAPTLDIPAILFSGGIFLYLLSFDPKLTLKRFFPFLMIPLLGNAFLTYLATGSPVPVYFRKELYRYPGSFWTLTKKPGLDGLREPKDVYLFHMLFGHHGVFVMTPILLFALWSLVKSFAKNQRYRLEAFLIGGLFSILVVAYAFKTRNYGGNCVGFRWLLFPVPLLFLFVARWIQDHLKSKTAWAFGLVFFVIGGLNMTDALQNPWRHSQWHKMLAKNGLGSVSLSALTGRRSVKKSNEKKKEPT